MKYSVSAVKAGFAFALEMRGELWNFALDAKLCDLAAKFAPQESAIRPVKLILFF